MNPAQIDNILASVGRAAPEPKYIRAYHGSPYDWDRVDMSMAGKGEGPLIEGFGLYATDDWGQGNWYRHRTARIARNRLAKEMLLAREMVSSGDPAAAAIGAQRLDGAKALASRLARPQPHGRLYELAVDADPESLLDFNRRLGRHPQAVQDRLHAAGPDFFDERMTGGDFYNALAGGNPFDTTPPSMQRAASERLFDVGIPGHRYDHGINNYVFYPGTEDSIRILRKYGLLAPIAAGAAMGEE